MLTCAGPGSVGNDGLIRNNAPNAAATAKGDAAASIFNLRRLANMGRSLFSSNHSQSEASPAGLSSSLSLIMSVQSFIFHCL